jgi:hypothetical protein
MGMGGHHQAPVASRHQGIAVPRRDRHAALGIEIERRRTLEHRIPPEREIDRDSAKISHYFPQDPTL